MLKKKDVLWNAIGSLVYSIFNSIILMFCTRLNGTEIAGIFSISYATGCILNSIGDWGIRIYQVTDTNRKFNFSEYLFSRAIIVFFMMLIGTGFVFINGYTNEKLFICMVIILLRVVDNFSDTFQAEFQLQNRLDISGKILLLRNLVEILIFAILDYLTHNIYISFAGMLISGVLMLIVLDIKLIKKCTVKQEIKKENVKSVIKECFPFAISTILSMYIINAVKYSIDLYGNNTMQTFFNILYMPTFAINLVSIVVIKSFLKVFGDNWNNKEYKKFIKIIVYILLILIASTVIIEIVCMVIGIPVLNFIYAVELSDYKIDLMLLVISGLFYAMSTVIFYALATIRKQKSATIVYIFTSIFAFIISKILVERYKMFGATISNTLIMLFLIIGLIIILVYNFCKNKDIELNNRESKN